MSDVGCNISAFHIDCLHIDIVRVSYTCISTGHRVWYGSYRISCTSVLKMYMQTCMVYSTVHTDLFVYYRKKKKILNLNPKFDNRKSIAKIRYLNFLNELMNREKFKSKLNCHVKGNVGCCYPFIINSLLYVVLLIFSDLHLCVNYEEFSEVCN